MNKVVFRERQRFDNKWLWLIIAITVLVPIILGFVYDKGFWITILVGLPALLLIVSIELRTEIGEEGISVKFFPIFFFDKLIKWEEIEKLYVRQYKPLAEYGGWGVRITYKNGMAYNIRGNKGIQIVFKNGKRLLIGTQKPDEASQTILFFNAKLKNNENALY